MRASIPVSLVACMLAIAPAARAGSVETWTTQTAAVDPATQTFNGPPAAPPPSALPVNVYLPDGYDGQRRFPVLYLLHGHGDNYSSWVDAAHGNLLQLVRGLPAIVVMPEAAQGWFTDWWNGGARANPAWERYHLGELIPLVERRLRILPGRSNHAIAGLSMGGEGAVYYAEQRPGYFGSVASFSGALSIQRTEWPSGFNTQGQDYATVYGDPAGFYATGHNPTALVANLRHTRVLVRVGDGFPNPLSASELHNTFGAVAEAELRMHAQDFVGAAQRAGVDVTYGPHQGIHDWPYWRADLAAAIGAWGLFKPVPEQPSTWSYATVARHGEAWGYAFDFAAPPSTVESFSFDRCTLSGTGAGSVRVTQPGGRSSSLTLPFSTRLSDCPQGASATPRRSRVRRRAARRRRPARRPRARHHARPRLTG